MMANGTDREGKRGESVEELTTELVDMARRRGDDRWRRARRRETTTVAKDRLDPERTMAPRMNQWAQAKRTSTRKSMDILSGTGDLIGRGDDDDQGEQRTSGDHLDEDDRG